MKINLDHHIAPVLNQIRVNLFDLMLCILNYLNMVEIVMIQHFGAYLNCRMVSAL